MLHALTVAALALPQVGPDPIDAHSEHGAAFDIGPRQAAVLMEAPDRIDFPVTLAPGRDDLAAYFEQGIAQLHGFWHLEAERSFRQVLAGDPDCAMAQWGLALANVDQPDRAAWFARAAWLKRGLVTERERMYIDMIARFYSVEGPEEPEGLVEPTNPAPGDEEEDVEIEDERNVLPERPEPTKKHAERLIKDYEELIWEYPEDIEAKALLANRIWLSRGNDIPTTSRMAVEALIQEVLAVEPMHPAHHYRIHLWDSKETAKRVVESAVKCGPSWPGIAHNWHMGGHIFAKLGRHFDAAWQQEASARIDHAHMARYWILPDEIHNFAHNNEWLSRSLRYQGRVTESIELAKNMIELPRHPQYNMPPMRGSSSSRGRHRLVEVLTQFEQWETLRELAQTMYLEPHVDDPEGAARAFAMGQAAFVLDDVDGIAAAIDELTVMFDGLRDRRAEAVDEAEEDALADGKERDEVHGAMAKALEDFERQIDWHRHQIESLETLKELAEGGDVREALEALEEQGYEPNHLARMMVEAGVDLDDDELRTQAVEIAREASERRHREVLEQATLAYVLWEANEREEALEVFEELREDAALAELDLPPLQRLSPLAAELGLPADWRPQFEVADDVGERIDLDTLGPRHWMPPTAPDFALADGYGNAVALKDYSGGPVLVVNFLGFGCVHCVEQLQALVPWADRFSDAGIEIVAIGLQPADELKSSLGADPTKTGFPFPILADPTLQQFKAYRAYDDFEEMALHGTYLVDGAGRVRWHDISHLPFMEIEFLLEESQRLLALPVRGEDEIASVAPIERATPVRSKAAEPTLAASPPTIPSDARRVGLTLETTPHCQNCIADLQTICSTLSGFLVLQAEPNDARIEVVLASDGASEATILEALQAGGRPGRLE